MEKTINLRRLEAKQHVIVMANKINLHSEGNNIQ